jgi:hypothetical protein
LGRSGREMCIGEEWCLGCGRWGLAASHRGKSVRRRRARRRLPRLHIGMHLLH